MSVRSRVEGLSAAKQALLARRLRERAAWRGDAAGIVPVERDGPLPLSFGQERLWFIDQYEPNTDTYNVAHGLRWRGPLDLEALDRALRALVARHESLRTTFAVEDGVPHQVIGVLDHWEPSRIDVSGHADPEQELVRAAHAEARRPFDLARGPLFRATVIRRHPEDHVLVLAMHHIATDGWSIRILQRELVALYAAFRAGAPDPLAPLAMTYVDYAVWQRRQLEGPRLDEELAFWKRELERAPRLELPTDRVRPALQTFHGATHDFEVPADCGAAFAKLAREEGVTPFMAFLAAFTALLAKYAGQDEIVVGTGVANRSRAELDPLVGFFVNMLAVRVELAEHPTTRELFRRVRDRVLAAQEHAEVPFERVVEALRPPRDRSRHPIFQVTVTLFADGEPEQPTGVALEPVRWNVSVAKFDLSLGIEDSNGRFRCSLEYNTDLFERATIERLAAHFVVLLEGMTARPDRPVAALPILTVAERRQLTRGASSDVPHDARPVHERFAEHVRARPEQPAIVVGAETMTYAQLDARAGAIEAALAQPGLAAGSIVALCLPRGADLVAAAIAVVRAGCAYLPIDVASPPDRIAYMLADAQAAALVTTRALADAQPSGHRAVVVDDVPLGGEPPAGRAVSPSDAAYVIYTSGTTGRPKGTIVEHAQLSHLVAWHERAFDLTAADRTTQLASIGFDAAVWEIWGTLACGATLHVIDDATRSLAEALRDTLHARGITIAFVPTPIAEQLLGTTWPATTSLRYLLTGGDRLTRRPPPSAPYSLVNNYGPTECAVVSTSGVVTPGADAPPSIGRAIDRVTALVLDAALEPVPIGVPGELFIGGPGVARGYLGQPALTAERFVQDPEGPPGARLYRTGDRVRRLPSGELEFLGRLDHQVKIRGFRIEVGEVEAVLAALDGVRECCVIAHHAPPAEPRLVAYVVPAAEAALAADGLRRALGRTLPDYMVPTAFVLVDGLPLTANGKVDRKALPAPDGSTLRAAAYVAPRTPLEASLAEIWSELLGVDRVGIEDDFFALGGHSLLATRLVARVHRALDVELPVRVLFEASTVRALASLVGRNTAAPDDLPLVRVERDQPPQLSFAQERLWFLAQLEPDLTAYTIPLSLRLTGALDVRVLERALEEILRRHDVLRTTITAVDGKPVVRIAPLTELALPVVDMIGANEAEVQRYAESDAARPFDLARSALRVALLRVGHDEHVLLVSLHHIVTDGWSMQLLHRELSALYDAFAAGRASPLPALPIRFHDFAAWQRARMLSHGQRHLEFWKEHLTGAPPAIELPTDRPHARSQMHRGELETLVLDHELGDELVRLGQREGASLFMTMLAAFSVVLARLAGQGEVVVGAPIAQRTRPELEGLIGMFLNNLALRVDVSDNPSFRTLLRRVRATTLAAYEHQDAPFEKIVELLNPDRDLGRPPIFQVMLVASNFPREELRLGGLAITPVHLAAASSKYELTLYIDDTPDGLELAAVYSADLFDRARIRELLAQLAYLTEDVVSRPDAPVLELALRTPTARRVLPDARAHLDQPSYEPVANTIAAIGRDHRSWIAIEWEGRAMTFGELATASGDAAHALVGASLARGNVVAVRGRPSPGLVAWMLGVLRAGGALMLLDPALPVPRQIMMMRAAHARVLVQVGDEPVAEWTPEVVLRASSADGRLADAQAEAATRPLPAIGGDDPAYVFFTSGTTGTPKGVLGCHKGLSHFVSWQRETFEIGPGDRAAQLTGLSFDVVLRDILTPLSSGATLCLRPEGVELEAEPLFAWMASSGVTMAHAVPSVMQVWLQERGPAPAPQLRLLFMAGEPLAAPLVERMREVFGTACRIINLYGPTETTLAKCFHEVVGAPRWGIQPVGRAMPHAQALVLNAAGAACGIGEPGEIVIRTPFRSLGYLDDPTGGRFVPSPFADDPDDVVYRTGDRGRYAVDGTLEILGRIDDQVKIRGVRVEPAEVTAVLLSHPAVAQGVVTVQRTPEPALVAYVVLSDTTCDESQLRTYLADQLVPAMVPKAFVQLDKLPLTANGKVDRRALPAPDETMLRRGSYVAPRTPLEEALAEIWCKLLGVDRVGVHDDFFDLGGHSLLAMRVVAHVRRRLGVELSVRAFFETKTLEGLARELAPKRAAEPEVAPRGDRPPLSFGQQRLWFLHQMDPTVNAHVIEAVHRYEGLDVERLRRAFEAVVARHEILRTSFPTADGEPYQHVHPPAPWDLPVEDARALDEAGQAAVLARVDAEQYRPFDLATGPLLRTRAVLVGPNAMVLHVVFQHIILDGASLELFWRELWRCYDALVGGRTADAPPPARQYVDYAAWQRAWLSREEIERQLAFWTAYLAGAPEDTALPFKAPRPPRQTFGGRMHTVTVDAARAAPLRALVREHGASLFMGISAAFRALLLRYTGQADIVLGTFITNRASAEFDDLLGLFVNTLVLRNEIRDDDTFSSLLGRERTQTLAAYDHQHTPFELVVDALGVERSLSRTPVFQVMHTHEGELTTREPGLDTGVTSTAASKTTVDLLLVSGEQDGRLVLTFFYNTDLFDQALIEQLARHLQQLIDGASREPRRRLFELPLLDEDDRAQLRAWGSTSPAAEPPRFVHELVADHVERTPEAIAVEHAATRLTYRELAARSERVAAWLAQRGVTRGDRVALCLERSADMVAAMFGVLHLGAAYVPIDPEYPLARRELMRRDAGAAVELTDEALRAALTAAGPAPRAAIDGEDVAYVIYTSGSTGTPKGVRVPHRAVANYLVAMRGPQGVTASDAVAAIASLSFDAHVIDILLPLANGARCVIADRDTTRDGDRLARLLDEREVTFMFATPATWRALLATGWRPSPRLRAHAGGEAVPPDLAAMLLAHTGSTWNGYGPTETTVYASCTRLVAGQPVTIGRPLAGLHAYVLDRYGQPAPIGVAGELHVGGAAVALGYHDRPSLTAERFLPDPFAGEPGARMYRTGDRVRWTRAGALEYLGRVDTQIKLRGLRIELGEIEAAVRTAAHVADVAVLLREDVPGTPRLVAYLATGGALDEAALRGALRTSLPEYMVPTAFVALPALPLSANGKLDRRALPAPLDARSANVMPRDVLEQAVVEIEGLLRMHASVNDCAVVVREDGAGHPRLVAYATASDEAAPQSPESEATFVGTWEELYERTYSETDASVDPTFNITGWNSSYTGQPLSEAEMREWVATTVERIQRVRPRRVLEIGCGSGLLLFQLAPRCAHYVGLDFSATALSLVQHHVRARGLDHVRLIHGRADDLSWVEPGSFDAVVINSVVQYFPSADYLAAVLERAAAAVAPGGAIFVGDVRSLTLLEAFHASVEVARADETASVQTLDARVRRNLALERELVVAPSFFRALQRTIPTITHVEVAPQLGRADNEMTRFRYHALLHVGAPGAASCAAAPSEWIDWTSTQMTVADLRGHLDSARPAEVALRNIPNVRVETSVLVGDLVRAGEGTVGELRRTVARHAPAGVHPADLTDLGHELGYEVELSWLSCRADGAFDAVLRRTGTPHSPARFLLDDVDPIAALDRQTNRPLHHRLDVLALRTYLKDHLPDYKIPSAFVVLDELPRALDGKLDGGALPAPDLDASSDYVAPRDTIEKTLAEIWCDVLGVPRVGLHDDFFALGGHSLLAMRVIEHLRRRFGVELPVRELFAAPTLERLARELAVRGALVRIARDSELPLSFAQERLWFLSQLEPDSTAYTMSITLHLRGRLDVRVLERAIDELFRRHEVLRTTIASVDGKPRLAIHPPTPRALPIIDVAGASDDDLRRHAEAFEARPFAHAEALVRVALLRAHATEHVLVMPLHHLITDGWSIEIMVRELFALYSAFVAGKPSPLAPLPLDFVDFAAWQRATMTAGRAERSLAYWTEHLTGAPPAIELPTDRPHRARQTHRGEWEALLLDRALTDRVLGLGRREGTSLFMTMLAALAVVLDRQAGQGTVVVGAPISQRSRPELEDMLGLFLNTLALRVDVGDRPSFRALLQRVRETALASHEHQDVPFEQIVERLRPERNLSRPPIFQVMLVAANFPQETLQVEGLTITPFARAEGSSRYDFTLYTDESPAGLQLALAYNADLFDRPRMKDLLAQLAALLVEVTAQSDAPARSIDTYALTTPVARGALPDPRAPLDARWYGAVSEVFSRVAAAQPERLAVADAREQWTYGELEQRANQLAHHLIAAGVQRGERVAIAAERTAGLAWAVLGVLKAGAAFVILDPAYPEARRVAMLDAAGARALVRVGATPLPDALATWCSAAGLCANVELPARGAIGTSFDQLPSTPPAISLTADDLAYVAFTSGSAGRPKGVLGRHGPLSHFHAWRCQEFGLTPNDRFTMLSGLAHDPLHRDLFTPLSLGASLHVLDTEAMKSPGRLAAWMANEQITVTHLTPALGRLVTETAEASVPSLRWIFLVGEALSRRDVDALRHVAPRATCVNYYGTTETQQALAYHVVRPEAVAVPLGRGAPDVQLLVIAPGGRLAGVGELGEIYVRSPHLAAGYLGDAELTAARFMTNPLNPTAEDDRVYRTGDLGRYTPSGEVVFAGRGDLQVKVRGFRVELGEVEAALAAHPAITEAAVVAHHDEDGDAYLVGYTVAREALTPDALRTFLRATLPDYMEPSAFVSLARLPVTPNGKVDRKALPAPAAEARHDARPAASLGPLEAKLADIWRTVLRVDHVGADDNFFDLGGHSLLAVQMIARTRRALGLDLSVHQLFEAPTIRALAAQLAGERAPAARDLPLRPPVRGDRPPLSFAQHRLWFLHRLAPDDVAYQIADVRHLDHLDTVALRRAFEALIARHEILRTTFPEIDGEPYQHVHPPTACPLPVEDARALDDAGRAAVLARVEAAQRRPFDLAAGPLLRAALVRVGDDAYAMFVTLHHIITDGWSQDVFWRELWSCYDACVSNRAPALPPLSLQYADYAAWQRGWLAGAELERQLAFWTERLAGAPEETPLPVKQQRPQLPSARAHHVVDHLDRETSARLHALAQREGATMFMTLLAALRTFLAGATGQGDLVIGTPIANRNQVELEGLIGLFVNTLALRGAVDPEEPFTSLLAREKTGALAAYAHQDAPFELVVDALGLKRRLDRTPLFQVWFVHQNTPHDAPMRGGDVAELATSPVELATKFDLTLHSIEDGDQIGLTWVFDGDRFEEATIAQFVARYRALLTAVAAQPHRTIGELLSR